jgi:hypothetical protein
MCRVDPAAVPMPQLLSPILASPIKGVRLASSTAVDDRRTVDCVVGSAIAIDLQR